MIHSCLLLLDFLLLPAIFGSFRFGCVGSSFLNLLLTETCVQGFLLRIADAEKFGKAVLFMAKTERSDNFLTLWVWSRQRRVHIGGSWEREGGGGEEGSDVLE